MRPEGKRERERKKKRGGDIQRGQREREEENEKGRYFGSCEKKNIYIYIY